MTALPCSSDDAREVETIPARLARIESVLRGLSPSSGMMASAEGMTITVFAADIDAGKAFRALLQEVGDGGR